jgi:hypothetical protein
MTTKQQLKDAARKFHDELKKIHGNSRVETDSYPWHQYDFTLINRMKGNVSCTAWKLHRGAVEAFGLPTYPVLQFTPAALRAWADLLEMIQEQEREAGIE